MFLELNLECRDKNESEKGDWIVGQEERKCVSDYRGYEDSEPSLPFNRIPYSLMPKSDNKISPL